MQYFRNTPRRMMDYQNPRNANMFPLCRNDAEARMGDTHGNRNGCGCSGNTRNMENERNERTGGHCGCEKDTRNTEMNRSERTGECMNNRNERTDGCMDNNRNERMGGCMNNNRNERTDGCMDNNRNDRMGDCLNNRNDRMGSCMDNNRNERMGDCMNNNRNERMGDCMNNRNERMGDCRDNNRNERMGGCGCGENDNSLRCDNTPTSENYGCMGLAMAFVPEQEFIDLNDAEEALCRGTLFRQLDMPFYGQRRRNCK